MDKDAERQKLEDRLAVIDAYIAHPISRDLFLDNQVEQDKAVHVICDVDIDSISGFFAHFAMVGHLRGLRHAKSLVMEERDDVIKAIKDLDK